MRAMRRTNVSRLLSVSAASCTDSWGEGKEALQVTGSELIVREKERRALCK